MLWREYSDLGGWGDVYDVELRRSVQVQITAYLHSVSCKQPLPCFP